MDSFICGVCRRHFDDVGIFLNHKRSNCHLKEDHDQNEAVFDENCEEDMQIEVVVVNLPTNGHLDTEVVNGERTELAQNSSSGLNDGETIPSDLQLGCSKTHVNGTSKSEESTEKNVTLSIEERERADMSLHSVFVCRLCNHYAMQEEDVLKHLLLKHEKIVLRGSEESKSFILSLQPLQSSEVNEQQITLKEVIPKSVCNLRLQAIRECPNEEADESTVLLLNSSNVSDQMINIRRKGRPRKIDVPKQIEKPESLSSMQQKQKNDNLVFSLSADGLYRCDRCSRSFRKERHIRSHRCFALDPKYVDFAPRESSKINILQEPRVPVNVDSDFHGNETDDFKVTDDGKGDVVSRRLKRIPVFRNEQDRVAFKERLSAVDLKCVDHLYSKHYVEQQIKNSDCDSNRTKLQSQNCKKLLIFSCNVCSKVFKNTSQIRLHCLIHSDQKPFKCTECSYASNTKGNLYTHFRKHTGNSYRCSRCEFSSCNRSHVTEHEATHSVQRRHTCRICKNHYRTVKSLANHVRKYHCDSLEDRDYVASFSSSKFTGNLLHECQICHRKFKKKLDKERHLHLHGVHDSQRVSVCELCTYKTVRRVNLEKHFRRHHRVIYCCSRCTGKFSSMRSLRKHLSDEHTLVEIDYDTILTDSIESSWFLDEPEAGLSVCNDGKLISRDKVQRCEGFVDLSTLRDGESSSVDESMVLRLIKRLKYKRLSTDAYETLRETLGKEECEICGRLFHSVTDLVVHRRCHVREIPFRSQKYNSSSSTNDKCEKTLSSPVKLRQHLDLTHPEVDSRSDTTLNSNKYINRRRFGKRSLKCPYCDRVFNRSISDLKKHIWIHEGIKPFKCSVCFYTCRSRNNLNVHMLRHSDDKPQHCLECGRSYKSKAALRWHQKLHENGQLLKYHSAEQHSEFHGNDFVLKQMESEGAASSSNISINSSTTTLDVEGTDEVTNVEIYRCHNCDSFFESLTEMTHHLKVKHNLPAQNLTNLKLTEFQLVNEVNELQDDTNFVPSAATADELSTMTTNFDNSESVATATVDVIQQIIDQGGLETGHLTLHTIPEGLQLAMNPETFIIHDDDGRAEVVVGGSLEDFERREVTGTTVDESSEYTIQFVTEPMNGFLSGGNVT